MNLRTHGKPAPSGEQLAQMRRDAWSYKTPAETLRKFTANLRWGESLDPRVKEGIARNPSSPPEALAQVVTDSPRSFIRNPSVPLLTLAMPEFCGSLPAEGLARVLSYADAPPLLVAQTRGLTGFWFAAVAEAGGWHITQRPEIPDREWKAAIREYWFEALPHMREGEDEEAMYGYSPGDMVWELYEHGLIPHALALASPLIDPLPGYTYEGYRSRANAGEARAMDQGRKKPPRGELNEFPEEARLYRYLGAAFSDQANGEDLAQWAEKHACVALAAAQNSNLAPLAWKRLAGHYHPGVRRLMLRRPDLPHELKEHARLGVLKRAVRSYLNYNSGPEVRLSRFVAQFHAPDPVRRPFWRSYAFSPEWQDRLAAAVAIGPRPNGRPMRARHALLLERLTQDGNVLVRAAARARLRGEEFSW